jgi:ubiquinone/menaquinone biosynthesis C-methylase UbiE
MERLVDAVELLDGPLEDPLVLAANLRDLGRINRWLGGVALSAAAIRDLAMDRPEVTLIDVGTGGADIPLALIRAFRRRAQRLTVVGIDSRAEVLAAAARRDPTISAVAELTLQVGDGRSLPFPDDAFDIAHTSLVMHHLTPAEAIVLLSEMARVARVGVVINDLDRSRIGWLGAWLIGHLLTSNRYTRHDAPLSVRRAYRPEEMADLIRASELTPVRLLRASFGQRYAIVARPDRSDRQTDGPLSAAAADG